MNEWFKNFSKTIKEKWGKWTIVQKGILVGIFVVIIAGIVLLAAFSSKPTTVRLFNKAIVDETERDRILTRLDQDNVKAYVSSDGYISVETETIAKKWRSKLIAEGYEPSGIDAYQLFDVSRWTRNDFDDKVNWQRATTAALEEHLKQLDGIQQAKVMLSLPDDALFAVDQKPVTASVVLYARGGSDVLQSKKSVQGIEHLIMRSVEGLSRDNITIVDGSTNQEINDFDGMEETDRINNIQKEQKVIQKLEAEYSSAVLAALQSTYGVDRVRVATMKIKMDMSKRAVAKKEYTAPTIEEDNPNTPYNDGKKAESGFTLSEETVNKSYTGTQYNPEGPAGVDGQNPPVYSDMSNMIGKSTEDGAKKNYALNKKNTTEDESPSIDSMSVSVNIDGTWKYPLHDEKGNVRLSSSGGYEREYIPVPEEDLKQVVRLVQGAIGYDKQRGDIVEVTSLQIDRTEQFRKEDEAFIKSQQTKKMFFFILLGIAVVLVTFIVFRIISREIERRRRLREEELLRRQQEERERALWDAKNEGMEVSMTVEERKRQELAENAIALAKEHPEDVAMLIRTWLREEA